MEPPRLTIAFPENPAVPQVDIQNLTPFQVLLAAALVARIADKVMTDLEHASMGPTSPLVVAQRIPPGGN